MEVELNVRFRILVRLYTRALQDVSKNFCFPCGRHFMREMEVELNVYRGNVRHLQQPHQSLCFCWWPASTIYVCHVGQPLAPAAKQGAPGGGGGAGGGGGGGDGGGDGGGGDGGGGGGDGGDGGGDGDEGGDGGTGGGDGGNGCEGTTMICAQWLSVPQRAKSFKQIVRARSYLLPVK